MENLRKHFKVLLTAIVCVLVIGVGWVDYRIGADYSMLLFYLMLVLTAAWFIGKPVSIMISVECVIVMLIVDLVWKKKSAGMPALYWNDLSNLVFFILVTYIIASLKSAFEYKKLLANTDDLTGLVNRRRFYELASAEIDRLRRYGHPFTICYIDIDNFKYVNDTYGHNEGDKLLSLIAKNIKNNMRKTDIVGRLGGDEFALLMPETDANVALSIVEKIKTIRDIAQKIGLNVTLSIGMIAYMTPPETVEEMINRADNLMYSVKTDGKNNIKYEIVGDSPAD